METLAPAASLAGPLLEVQRHEVAPAAFVEVGKAAPERREAVVREHRRGMSGVALEAGWDPLREHATHPAGADEARKVIEPIRGDEDRLTYYYIGVGRDTVRAEIEDAGIEDFIVAAMYRTCITPRAHLGNDLRIFASEGTGSGESCACIDMHNSQDLIDASREVSGSLSGAGAPAEAQRAPRSGRALTPSPGNVVSGWSSVRQINEERARNDGQCRARRANDQPQEMRPGLGPS